MDLNYEQQIELLEAKFREISAMLQELVPTGIDSLGTQLSERERIGYEDEFLRMTVEIQKVRDENEGLIHEMKKKGDKLRFVDQCIVEKTELINHVEAKLHKQAEKELKNGKSAQKSSKKEKSAKKEKNEKKVKSGDKNKKK